MVNVPYIEAGLAAFEQLDTHTKTFLNVLLAPKPPIAVKCAPGTSFEAFSVVGLDGSGNLALAEADGTPKARYILTQAVPEVQDESLGEVTVPVWYSGQFGNLDALVWHASFTTDELKLAAFDDAPTPTTIVVSKRY
jgi:hypothetical protein